MSDSANYVVKGDDGIDCIVVACKICTHNGAEKAEHRHKVERSLLDSSLGEGRQRDGYKLDAAKEQRKHMEPAQRVISVNTTKDDLENLY